MDEKQKKEYEQYVSRITPTHNLLLQMIKIMELSNGQTISNIKVVFILVK